jgi:hypothetical protein
MRVPQPFVEERPTFSKIPIGTSILPGAAAGSASRR